MKASRKAPHWRVLRWVQGDLASAAAPPKPMTVQSTHACSTIQTMTWQVGAHCRACESDPAGYGVTLTPVSSWLRSQSRAASVSSWARGLSFASPTGPRVSRKPVGPEYEPGAASVAA